MSFANPQYLWMMPASIAFAIVFAWFATQQRKKFEKWIAPELWKSIIPDFSLAIFKARNLTLALAIFFIAFALGRPQWGEREESIRSEGMDLIFVLDVSNSMLSEDVPPSRLARAQSFIKKTSAILANDRIGIVAFAGSAYMAAPLTTDFGYIAEIVDSLDPSVIAHQGTDLGQALDVATRGFERGGEDDHKTSRAIIVISDGEDFGTSAKTAAQAVKTFGAGFFTFSVGSSEGSPIPVRSENGILQNYKKDGSGKTVLTKVNRELLSQVAEAGGGTAFELINPEDSAYTLAKQLQSFSRNSQKEQRQVTKIDRFMYFLLAGIVALFVNLCLGHRKLFRKSATLFLLLVPFFGSQPAQAQTLEEYLNNRKGVKEFSKGDFDSSAKSFDEAKKTDPDNSTLNFNEGTALANGKHPEDAIVHFQESTKKALSQGDYDTAAKSLYNEGVTQLENKNLKEGYDRLTKAIEMAKISGQPDVEKIAREALLTAIDKQKQQSQDKKNQKDQKDKKDGSGKDDKSSGSGKDEKNSKDSKDGKNQDQKNQNPTGVDQRSFKSGTLSKDVAEGIMNDLSDREKQLFQHRMKEGKNRETHHENDW